MKLRIRTIRITRPTRQMLLILLTAMLLFGGYTDGVRAVTTAGTRVQLSTAGTSCISLTIQAQTANAGTIFIGGSDVLASTKTGIALTAGTAAAFLPSSTTALYAVSAVWLDATSSGDAVSYACYR